MASEQTSDLNAIDSDNSGKLFRAKEFNTAAKPPKTNAEHQKAFRERQKINKRERYNTEISINAALNALSKTKKTQSEHCKEYQHKSRLKRHRVPLNALLFERSEAPQWVRNVNFFFSKANASIGFKRLKIV
ncbi:hypothetical protein KQX54_011566 [Cotesia glomerata]|uniref:Uncharacterized protein n=1 Tax=Cotesia glomerata TaxID=32391 RepID=A0AAV7IKD0_COTGL|nr:hypothetical protein KQX54_011566 [Cotesia glomerata]